MTTTESTRRAAPQQLKAPRKAAGNDALKLLHSDHEQVQGLFEQFEKARTADRKERLAAQICAELKVHAQIEEEIFYPAARRALKSGDLLDEATVEHASAKALIEQIEALGSGEPMFDARVKVLSEYITHHVNEEEKELFPQLRKADIDLVALGETLSVRKAELMERPRS
jgi:hemerythrin superfamily protein